jgi:hypothetical protein
MSAEKQRAVGSSVERQTVRRLDHIRGHRHGLDSPPRIAEDNAHHSRECGDAIDERAAARNGSNAS